MKSAKQVSQKPRLWGLLDMVMPLPRQHAATAGAIDGSVEPGLVLGGQVRGMGSLCLARPRSQNGLTKAIWR